MIGADDASLFARLRNYEDAFVERKTAADSKDWLKTVVGFANSTPIGYPAVLFIGVRDDGTIERTLDLDSLQKTLRKKLQEAYPAIYYLTRVLRDGDRQCLSVIVPGSKNRPHFAGPSYIRVGSETKMASEAEFDCLIAERQSEAFEILRWKNKLVTVDYMNVERVVQMLGAIQSTDCLTVVSCTPLYVTLAKTPLEQRCIPLKRIRISFDMENNRLRLEVAPT